MGARRHRRRAGRMCLRPRRRARRRGTRGALDVVPRHRSPRTARCRAAPPTMPSSAALVEVLGAAPGTPGVLEFLPYLKELDRQLADIEHVRSGSAGPHARAVHVEPARAERPRPRARRAHRRTGPRAARRGVPGATRRCHRGRSTSTSASTPPLRSSRSLRGTGLIQEPRGRRSGGSSPTPPGRPTARADWDRVGDRLHHLPGEPPRRGAARQRTCRGGAASPGRTFADLVATRDGHPSDVLADWVARARPRRPRSKVGGDLQQRRRGRGRADGRRHHRGRRERRRRAPADDVWCRRRDPAAHRSTCATRGDFTRRAGRARAHRPSWPTPSVCATVGSWRRATWATWWCSRSTSSTYEPEAFVHDVPGGAPRLTRPAGGYRATVVAGVVTQEGGVPTGAPTGALTV